MRFSIVTPCLNSERFLEATLRSVLAQRREGADIEYIVVDGGSTDGTSALLQRYAGEIDRIISEPDNGPADAINKGLSASSGDVLAWLNADDYYLPGALARAAATLAKRPFAALCFGRCAIMDAEDREIRRGITRFKHACYPFSCRALIQTVNYVSQPAMFFRRSAWQAAGPLRTDLTAAWDYDLLLRLWRRGGATRVPPPALACFRWTPESISGTGFERQFREELDIAMSDAGRWSPQALAHSIIRRGIVAVYGAMARRRIMLSTCILA